MKNYGAIVIVDTIDDACAIANWIAPEHLQLVTRDDAAAAEIRHAGAIFSGEHTPEAVGDYLAGSKPRVADRPDRAFSSRSAFAIS